MSKQLNGWRRLWVLLSVTWTVFILVRVLIDWRRLPEPPPTNNPFIGLGLESLRDQARKELLITNGIAWVLPISGLYAFGWGIGWVRRGFVDIDKS